LYDDWLEVQRRIIEHMNLPFGINWSLSDFLAAGLLLVFAIGAYVLIARRLNGTRRLVASIAIAAVFLYIWAELSVGIFTQLGS